MPEPTESSSAATPESLAQQLGRRADQVMLKLLDKIERLAEDKGVDHLGVYEALCRAEAARRG
jgi:hypothetical protein